MQIFLTNTSRFTTGSVADLDLDFLAQRLKTDGALENMTGWRPFPGKHANMLHNIHERVAVGRKSNKRTDKQY